MESHIADLVSEVKARCESLILSSCVTVIVLIGDVCGGEERIQDRL